MSTHKKPLFVALCGIDGVGKTTLLRRLAEQLCDSRYFFVSRGPADCERMVEKTCARHYHDWRDWIAGPFAEAIAVACALDYAIYYKRVVAPVLGEELAKLHGLTCPEVVIADRHAVCFKAYAMCNENPSRMALEVLESIPPPDLILHINLPMDTILTRRDATARTDEFEHPEAQKRQLNAYERLFKAISCPVIRIDNTGPAEETCEMLVSHLEKLKCARD